MSRDANDDALIYRPILSVSDHRILQNDLHTLEQWANTWDMRFNPCKCYILSMKRAGVKSAIFYTSSIPGVKMIPFPPYKAPQTQSRLPSPTKTGYSDF